MLRKNLFLNKPHLLWLGLCAAIVLQLLFSISYQANAAPDLAPATPELVTTDLNSYYIRDPKVFTLRDPGCSPFRGAENEEAQRAPDAPVEQVIGRASVHGTPWRELYSHGYDSFCPSGNLPDIKSNIVADDDYIYWMSDEAGGFVRIKADGSSTTPALITPGPTDGVSSIVILDDTVYQLHSSGLYAYTKNVQNGGGVLLTSSELGTFVNNLQTDGAYLYWIENNGGSRDLRALRLSNRATKTLDSGVISYHPVAGNVVYIGYIDQIRSYSHSSNSVSSPIYSSSNSAAIESITADASSLYFIQNQKCTPACPGRYTLFRQSFGFSTPTTLFAPAATGNIKVMHDLEVSEDNLYFIRGNDLFRIPTDADSIVFPNLRIDGMEVTQGIQNNSNTVDLVRGRKTAVRLFASSDGAAIPGIQARLYRVDGAGNTIGDPIFPINLERAAPYLTVQASPDRDNINESFTFFLPQNWTSTTTLRLRAELNPFRFPQESTYSDNVLVSNTFDLDPSGRLETYFILFEYDSMGDRIAPRWEEDYLQTVSFIRRTYPLASTPGNFTDPSPGFRPRVTRMFDPNLGGNVDGSNLNPGCQRQIDAGEREAQDCAAFYVVCPTLDVLRAAEGISSDVPMIGMVSDGSHIPDLEPGQGGFPRGWDCGLTPTGTGDWGWDNDGSYGDWYAAHELGHFLGRPHPSQGSEECGHGASDPDFPWPLAQIGDESYRGFDMGSRGLNPLLVPRVYPNEWRDFMSYCNNQWISSHTYLRMKEFLTVGRAFAAAHSQPAGDYLQLSGVIFPNSNEIDMVENRLWKGLETAPAAPTPGPYRINLLNEVGAVLASHNFTPHHPHGAEISVLTMGEFVPFVTGTTRIEVTYLPSSTTLWSYSLTGGAPTVSNVELVGASSPVQGNVTIQWSASDPDGDSLSYNLLYSYDNGTSWKVVQLGIAATSMVVDTSTLGGSDMALFKIIAHDDFYQAEGVTAPFATTVKDPLVTLLSPQDGARFAVGQQVRLAADILSYEDAAISGFSIQWRDQNDNLIGLGNEFLATPQLVGENIVTLRVIYGQGQTVEKTFSFFVDDDLSLSEPILTVGPDQIGWDVAENETTSQTATLSVINSGAGSLTVSVSGDTPWLSVSQSGNTAPLQLTLTADPSQVSFGETLVAELTVTGASASGNQTVIVPVSLSKGGNPAYQDTRSAQTISFAATVNSGDGVARVGGAAKLVASASSGLPVSLSSVTPSICTVSGATVNFLAIGTCRLVAQQLGNDAFKPAAKATTSIAVRAEDSPPETTIYLPLIVNSR